MILADPFALDDPESIEISDPSGIVRDVAAAPAQLREAAYTAGEVDLSELREGPRPRAMVVVGPGRSALAGEVLAALAAPSSPVPVVVVRSGRLPGWVGAADLVVGLSGSGATQQTRSAVEEAVRRGVPVVGIAAAGSPLLEVVQAGRGLLFPVTVGRGARPGMWAVLAPLLVLAHGLGVVRVSAADLTDAADVLDGWTERCRPSKESFLNPAKELALAIADRVPLLWATSPLSAVVANRGARQLAARAAIPALQAALHEPADDQIALLDDPAAAEQYAVVLLRHDDEAQPVAGRAAVVRELAAERGVPVHELHAEGTAALSQLASLVAPIDFVCVYAAIARGLDPARAGAVAGLHTRSGR